MNKKQSWSVIITFGIIVFGLAILIWVLPDQSYSSAERRRLAVLPKLNSETIFSGSYSKDLETYLLDQFPGRDTFRAVKAEYRLNVLRQKDNNNLYIKDGSVYKIEKNLDENQVVYAANKINEVSEMYLQNCHIVYSIIPDKNYYTAANNGYPVLDYAKMIQLMNENVTVGSYTDLTALLKAEDYYRTDTHWRQEKIRQVADAVLQSLGSSYRCQDDTFTENNLSPFYGVYSGQLGLPVQAETLTYLNNELLQRCTVEVLGVDGVKKVYDPSLFESSDGYNIFLQGAQPLVTITDPQNTSGKELIIFRDSFGSSLAPLLMGGYSKITLVDLRYMNSKLLGDYIDFDHQDVLFIYSTLVLNSGRLLK